MPEGTHYEPHLMRYPTSAGCAISSHFGEAGSRVEHNGVKRLASYQAGATPLHFAASYLSLNRDFKLRFNEIWNVICFFEATASVQSYRTFDQTRSRRNGPLPGPLF